MRGTNKKLFVKAMSLLITVIMASTVIVGCGKDTSDKDEQGRISTDSRAHAAMYAGQRARCAACAA